MVHISHMNLHVVNNIFALLKVVAMTSEGKCESKTTKRRTAKDGCKCHNDLQSRYY